VSSGISEALLIHRDGTFLARYPLLVPSAGDWVAQARALIEMMNRVNASLGPGPSELQELTFGDTALRLELSAHLVLMAVVAGPVRPALVRRLRGVLEDLEMNYHAALTAWTGRPADLVGVDAFLRHLVARG
jgi:hypothetical protein